MTTKYIPLNSILDEIQNSMYEINKRTSKGVMIKNINLTLHCFMTLNDDKKGVLVHLLDFSQATNKDFKESALSQMKFTIFDSLTENKESKTTNPPQNTEQPTNKSSKDKKINQEKNSMTNIIKYINLPADFNDTKKNYNTMMLLNS